jgi:hypothetical protein
VLIHLGAKHLEHFHNTMNVVLTHVSCKPAMEIRASLERSPDRKLSMMCRTCQHTTRKRYHALRFLSKKGSGCSPRFKCMCSTLNCVRPTAHRLTSYLQRKRVDISCARTHVQIMSKVLNATTQGQNRLSS